MVFVLSGSVSAATPKGAEQPGQKKRQRLGIDRRPDERAVIGAAAEEQESDREEGVSSTAAVCRRLALLVFGGFSGIAV
jgi:hypothetical protein